VSLSETERPLAQDTAHSGADVDLTLVSKTQSQLSGFSKALVVDVMNII
jgi:hypothetical protein